MAGNRPPDKPRIHASAAGFAACVAKPQPGHGRIDTKPGQNHFALDSRTNDTVLRQHVFSVWQHVIEDRDVLLSMTAVPHFMSRLSFQRYIFPGRTPCPWRAGRRASSGTSDERPLTRDRGKLPARPAYGHHHTFWICGTGTTPHRPPLNACRLHRESARPAITMAKTMVRLRNSPRKTAARPVSSRTLADG